MIDRYAVIGHPVAHSKSPRIHAMFAEQTGQKLQYGKLLAPLDGFLPTIEEFQRAGGKGLNVTVPFKQEAFAAMDALSERARAAGAVNTIAFEAGGRRFGDNTDGAGLVRDLQANHGVTITGKTLLLLGAGGAVRGVLPALLAQKPAAITIANRTAERARELAGLFQGEVPIRGIGYGELNGHYHIVINGTSAGLSGDLPPLPEGLVAQEAVCYDMVYGDRPTVFQGWAQQQGARLALDGLGMLVEQAAESFLLWRGVRPQTAPVIAALREELRA